MRSRLWIVLWVIGILFPMGFLAGAWKPFGRLFDRAFAAGWSHILMHGFLYLILALLLAQWIQPDSLKAALLVLALAIGIGCLQEGLQWVMIKAEVDWSASAFDLMIDSAGTLLGLAAAHLWASRRKRAPSPVDRGGHFG